MKSTVRKTLAIAVAALAAGGAWADFAKGNPVTGASETYTYNYVGSGSWDAGDWRDSTPTSPDTAPQKPDFGPWSSLLIDGETSVSVGEIEGWAFNIGLFGGANLTVAKLHKWAGGCAVKVDKDSKLTISSLGDKSYADAIDFYVAAPSGITYSCDYGKGGTFYYYLAGNGSVAYRNLTGGNHVVKQADATLSGGAKALMHKQLVAFLNQPNFTVEALVVLKDPSGVKVGEAVLSSLNTTGSPTITTDDAAGTCELVRTASGLELYWIDGAADEKTVQPSISVNFTHNGQNLAGYSEFGAPGYSVSGYYWNNIPGKSGTTSTVYQRTTTGAKEEVAGLTAVISDTRGSWSSNGGNILHGYIDDTQNGSQSPQVVLSGIPESFTNYWLVLYFSNGDNGTKFGYVTINAKNYWGTDSWGSADFSAFAENGNYRVSPVIARGDGSLTITTHCPSGARAGLAAVQIVKADAEYIANDDGSGALVWNATPPASGNSPGIVNMTGNATLTVDSAGSFGKLSLAGVGTLTLGGSAKISAATIDVGRNVVLNVNADRLDATTFTGEGTVVYTGVAPAAGKGWTGDAWRGTVKITGVSNSVGDSRAGTWLKFNDYGNGGSTVELGDVSGWLTPGYDCEVPLKLSGTLTLNNGNSGTADAITIRHLLGPGTIKGNSSADKVVVRVKEWSGFSGVVNLDNKIVVFGEDTLPSDRAQLTAGQIIISEGAVVTNLNTATWWTAKGGIVVNGTFAADGRDAWADATPMTINGSGVLNMYGVSRNDTGKSYANVTGTGTVRFTRKTGWSALPESAANMFATTLSVVNDNVSDGVIVTMNGGSEVVTTNRNISGAGYYRSDWGSGAYRGLLALQSRNTTWSGNFGTSSRVKKFIVAGVEGAAEKTLTIAGTHSSTIPLVVEQLGSAKVTGTWKGAATVAGSLAFGSAGKVDGAVAAAAGAALDYTAATGTDHITGALTLTATTTVHLPAGATFPYKLASSISGVDALAAGQYTIGGSAGVDPLRVSASSGQVYLNASATISSAGGTVDWDDLVWTSSEADGLTVNVSESGTLNLGTASASKVTFNVASGKVLTLTGVVTAPEVCIAGEGTVLCSGANTLAGFVTGSGTVKYPDHTLPNASAVFSSGAWAGTLILPNCGRLNNAAYPETPQQQSVRFDRYGSANSRIKAPGFRGDSAVTGASANVCQAELVVDGDATVEFNHGDTSLVSGENDVGFIFRKLSGSGLLKLDGTSDKVQYVFRDVAGFTGSVLITDPTPDDLEGGKKSFIFGADEDWSIANSSFPAYLVAASNVTVAAGRRWDVPAGIVILDDAAITLADGASVSRISTQSGGILAVAEGATGSVVEAKDGRITAKIDIASGATLNIGDTNGIAALTVPADSSADWTYRNNGDWLDLTGCSSMKTLHLVLGESTSFDLGKVRLPASCETICYDVGEKRDLAGYTLPGVGAGTNFCYYATETVDEYAADGRAGYFTITNVPAGASVRLLRRSGAVVDAAPDGQGSTTYIYAGGGTFSGNACWHEWDFENSADYLKDTGRFLNDASNWIKLQSDSPSPAYRSVTVNTKPGSESKNAISSVDKPYPAAAMAFPANWSAAVRCSMPSAPGQLAVAFGDVAGGVLGLASGGQEDFVELFSWTNGVKTVLAQLKVESPADADNMHIYVFAVTNDTEAAKDYVSFYRDGELIHTAEFKLNGAITTFKVGDVAGTRPGDGDPIPAAAATGHTDYVRLYDKVVDQSIAEALSARRPFASSKDTYVRTMSIDESWVEADAWLKQGAETSHDSPADGNHVTVSAPGTATVSVNLAADSAYDTLIFTGGGAVSLMRGDNAGKISAEMVVVRTGTGLTAEYNAVDFANVPVGVDQGARLTFNFTYFPFEDVTSPTNFFVTGPVVAYAYDKSVTNRISVAGEPADTWALSGAMAMDGGVPRYQVTITPDHQAGTDPVYYKDGELAAGMTVYLEATLETPTRLLAGDTVVVSDAADSGAVSVAASFNGNLDVTRAALTLSPSSGDAVLDGGTIAVADGSTVHFGGGSYGAMTLDRTGAGAVVFDDDAYAAGLSGTAGISVAAGKTLTLGSISTFVSGGVGGTGTVKLPTVGGEGSFDFRPYGSSGSTVALGDFHRWLAKTSPEQQAAAAVIDTTLRLDGTMDIYAMSDWSYSFARITGSGDIVFPNANNPTIAIAELADYEGTLVNNHESASVTVGLLSKSTGTYTGGDVLLTKGGVGSVTVSSIAICGEAKQGLWDGNNLCLAAAEYDSQKYKTVAEAIAQAGDAHVGDITVFESNETLGAKYMFVTEGGATKVALKPFAVYVSGTPSYQSDALSAVIAAGMAAGGYQYIEVLVGGSVEIPLNVLTSLKIKNSGGATLDFTGVDDDCTASEDASSPEYTVYTKSNKPTVYTWTGSAFDSDTGDPDPRWDAYGNWSYVDGSSQTATASRQPGAGDSVVFGSAAAVVVSGDTTVDAIAVGAALSLQKYSSDVVLTAASGGIVLTNAAASITLSGVTLSPTPTTSVAGSVVKATTSGGNTVYSVVDNTAATWVGGATGNWNDPANWSTGVLPNQNTVVTFPAEGAPAGGWSVNVNGRSARADGGDNKCREIVLEADVTINRANANDWNYLILYGNGSGEAASGAGALILNDMGLFNAHSSEHRLYINCPLRAIGSDNCFFGGNSGRGEFYVSGATYVDNVVLKAESRDVTFTGPVTIAGNGTVHAYVSDSIEKYVRLNGGITLAENANAELKTETTSSVVVKSGTTVTLSPGSSLKYRSYKTTVAGATFAAADANGYVTSRVDGSNTIWEYAAYKGVSNVAVVSYGADYANATVTATVDSPGTYTITTDAGSVSATAASAGTITFNDVPTGHADAYDAFSYTITVADGQVSGDASGTRIVADPSAWFNERAASPTGESGSAADAGGTWDSPVVYSNGVAEVAENTFVPAAPSSNDVVTVTIRDIVYPDLGDEEETDLDAQGSLCLGTNELAAVVFKVLVTNDTGAAHWVEASGAAAATNVAYDVEFVFDYTRGTYAVSVDGRPLTAIGATSWPICKTADAVREVEFKGAGTLTGIKGVGFEGNMVVDANGVRYASVADAIAAYNADKTIAPLVMLHDGTAPSGWRIVEGILKKMVKGLMVIAF